MASSPFQAVKHCSKFSKFDQFSTWKHFIYTQDIYKSKVSQIINFGLSIIDSFVLTIVDCQQCFTIRTVVVILLFYYVVEFCFCYVE